MRPPSPTPLKEAQQVYTPLGKSSEAQLRALPSNLGYPQPPASLPRMRQAGVGPWAADKHSFYFITRLPVPERELKGRARRVDLKKNKTKTSPGS